MKTYSVTARHYGNGVDLTSGAENLPPESLTVAENVRFNGKGGASTRKGHEEKGDLATSAKVDSIWTHEPYGVMFCKSGTGIYQSLDGETWYSIGVTRTASEKEFFWSYGKDVFVTNQTDSYLRIAVSTLRTALTTGSTEVDFRVGDGDSFTNGTAVLYIEGDEIDYTAISSDQATTVSNIATNHAAGAIITQTSTPSGAPKGTCIGELEGSILVGGVSANPSIVYYSAAATLGDPEFAYDFSANGAGTKKMPSDVKALGSVTGGVIIGLKKGIHYADQFQVDTGALITRELSRVHGVPNANCIVQADKRTYIFTGNRILPVVVDQDGVRIEDFPNQPQRNLDYPVRDLLTTLDEDQELSFGHYDPTNAEITYSVIKDGISIEIVLQEDIGAWSVDKGKSFSCKTNFKGRVYAGSDNTDKIYLDNEGTTDAGIPILHRIVSPLYVVDDRRVSSEYLKMTYGGLLSAIGEFTFRIYVNGENAIEELVTAEDLINKGLMSLTSGVPLGSGTVGANTIGSGGDSPDVFPFTYPYEMLLSGESIQYEWEIFDEGTQFELRDSKMDAETSGELYLDSI